MHKISTLFILLLLWGGWAKAGLTGTVTVPGTYATLGAVIDALNTQGVGSGGVIINITANQYAPAGGYLLGSDVLNPTVNVDSPIIINGNGNTITSNVGTSTGAGASTSQDGIFSIQGTDYVTINQLNLTDTNTVSATTKMECGYGLFKLHDIVPFDGCQHVSIKSCTINMSTSYSNSIGICAKNTIVAGTFNTLNVTDTASTNSYNVFIRNAISAGIGISLNGSTGATSVCDLNNIVGGINSADGNVINYYSIGCNLISQTNILVQNNSITMPAMPSSSVLTSYSITMSNTAGQPCVDTIRKNNIYITSPASGSGNLNFYAIQNLASGTSAVITIDSNIIGASITGSAVFYGIYNNGTPYRLNINANTIKNVVSTSKLAHYFIYNHGNMQPGGLLAINNNRIDSSAIIPSAGAAQTVYGIYDNAAIPNTCSINILGNRISNVNIAFSAFNGINEMGGGTGTYPYKNISYDSINNIHATAAGGGQQIKLLMVDKLGNSPGNSIVSNNVIFNDTFTNTSVVAISAYVVNANVNGLDFYNNIASGITSGTPVNVASISGGSLLNVYNNKFNNIVSNAANGVNYGLYISGGSGGKVISVYNNIVSDFTVAQDVNANAVSGMYFASNDTLNVYHNTIDLNLSNTDNNFGATGVYYDANVGSFDFRNNIVRVNAVPGSAGSVVALRRSAGVAGTLSANLFSASNGNIYYTPNATNAYLYAEGTTLPLANAYNLSNDPNFNSNCGSTYKAFMSPRENASFTENNLSQAGTVAGVYAPAGASYAKSGAVPTTSPAVATDFNGVNRATPADIGALQFTGSIITAAPPAITFTAIPLIVYCTGAPVVTAAISGVNSINTQPGTAPRMYYKKESEANAFGNYPADNASTFNGWKYAEAAGSASPFSFSPDYGKLTAPVAAGDSISYFIIAQDATVGAPRVSVNTAGFAAGYCLSSVNLGTAAGSVAATPVTNGYKIANMPAPVISYNGLAYHCNGDSMLLQGNTAKGLTYQWLLNNTPVSGATDTVYKAGVTLGGDYKLIFNSETCSDTSAAYNVTPTPVPQAVITAAGPLTFCDGDSVVLSGTIGATAYKWYEYTTNALLSNTPTYAATVTGVYQLVTIYSLHCLSTSATILVMVHPLPNPTITQHGDTLSTGAYAHYQWSKDGQPIAGATDSVYVLTQRGTYNVTVTDSNGCSKSSIDVNILHPVSVPGLAATKESVSLYPNPNKGTFSIKCAVAGSKEAQIEVRNVVGQVVYKETITTANGYLQKQVQLPNEIINGVYFLQIKTDNSNSVQRFVIER